MTFPKLKISHSPWKNCFWPSLKDQKWSKMTPRSARNESRGQSYHEISLEIIENICEKFCTWNVSKLKDESGIWTRALKDKPISSPALYQLSHQVLLYEMVWYKYLFVCAMSGSNLGVSIILVKFTKSAIF